MKVIYEDYKDIQMECDRLEDELHYLYKLEAIKDKFYKLRKDYKKLQKENIDLINKLSKEKLKNSKAKEWIIYQQQHSMEGIISTDELDDLLQILGDKENE